MSAHSPLLTRRVTQEQLAEHLKRIRNDYCEGSLRDTLNRFVPQPAGPRRAHIRVPEPLGLHDFAGSRTPRWSCCALACRLRSMRSMPRLQPMAHVEPIRIRSINRSLQLPDGPRPRLADADAHHDFRFTIRRLA